MISSISQKVALNDNQQMPGYGFGCYKALGAELIQAVNCAWSAGYRLFDSASFYKNEQDLGKALKKYPQDEVFLISKLWPTDFERPVKSLDESLKKLDRDYLDAYLLHWPGLKEQTMLDAYEKLLKEKEKGKIRNLGVSNFLENHLNLLKKYFDLWPVINQIESHPYFQQAELGKFCMTHNIQVMAWSPLGRGNELADPVLEEIAAAVNKSVAQVILRWHIQENRVPIPKSVHDERIRANAEIFDFSLTDEQIAAIDALEKPNGSGRRGPDPLTYGG